MAGAGVIPMMIKPPSTGMGMGLAVLEPLPQRENGRDAGSDQSAERERPGAASRETGADPGGGQGRGRTLTPHGLRCPRSARRKRLRGDLDGSGGCILGGDGRAVSQEE